MKKMSEHFDMSKPIGLPNWTDEKIRDVTAAIRMHDELVDKLQKSRNYVKAMHDVYPKNEEFSSLLSDIDELLERCK